MKFLVLLLAFLALSDLSGLLTLSSARLLSEEEIEEMIAEERVPASLGEWHDADGNTRMPSYEQVLKTWEECRMYREIVYVCSSRVPHEECSRITPEQDELCNKEAFIRVAYKHL